MLMCFASVGTNLLIRDGAFPIMGPDDLAEVLGLLKPLYTIRSETTREIVGRDV